ncbi:unnamed protein product [Owenia fusiformis]|uniref:Nucleoside diphosphate-linked moiety X motif 6 n=1 Tax=Owenia fusiformis TaxID=6347 RepID=A0A8J1TNJ0_OWEFU|nr:unnamed protein product [Owenia fusiformis]
MITIGTPLCKKRGKLRMAEILKGRMDNYGGITIVTGDKNIESPDHFDTLLKDSLEQWGSSGVRGVWVKVKTSQAELVPICTKHGFEFHHAQPGYVMLTKWLPLTEENHLPEYANQYLGAAGFVVNEKDEVLVVKEKYTHSSTKAKWKFPGGHADRGEDLHEASTREVFEETGVKCEFESILSFRHQHNYRFGLSDWYFMCLLRPITQELNPCVREIAECRWMHIDEYLSMDDSEVSDNNRYFAQCYKDRLTSGINAAIQSKDVLSWDRKRHHKVYTAQLIKPNNIL